MDALNPALRSVHMEPAMTQIDLCPTKLAQLGCAQTMPIRAWFLRMLQRRGRAAKLPFAVHCHMLRHGCGYKLANDEHDTRSLAHYLGHRNLQSTARYAALAPDCFAKFWQD